MSDNGPDESELRKFERELEHREKYLETTNELLQEVPSLLGELTNEVILPLLNSLQLQQQEIWSPPQSGQNSQNRGKPKYDPLEGNNQDIPAPQDINNEEDSKD